MSPSILVLWKLINFHSTTLKTYRLLYPTAQQLLPIADAWWVYLVCLQTTLETNTHLATQNGRPETWRDDVTSHAQPLHTFNLHSGHLSQLFIPQCTSSIWYISFITFGTSTAITGCTPFLCIFTIMKGCELVPQSQLVYSCCHLSILNIHSHYEYWQGCCDLSSWDPNVMKSIHAGQEEANWSWSGHGRGAVIMGVRGLSPGNCFWNLWDF